MKKIILYISGMHCDGCAKRIENSLKSFENVKSVNVSFKDKQAQIECDEKVLDTIKERISDLGFSIVGESYEENNTKN